MPMASSTPSRSPATARPPAAANCSRVSSISAMVIAWGTSWGAEKSGAGTADGAIEGRPRNAAASATRRPRCPSWARSGTSYAWVAAAIRWYTGTIRSS